MRLWIWRRLRMEVPDDWEMLQFAKSAETGACAFADRCRFRLEIDWKHVEAPPDIERLISDYEHKLLSEQVIEEAHRVRRNGWQGIEGSSKTGWTGRYGRYCAEIRSLLEIVLLWPGDRDRSLTEAVLDSVGIEEPRGGCQRWKAFGMDLLASEDLNLATCGVQPARTRMMFNDGRENGRGECFERLGMVEEWLRLPLEEWLAARAALLPGGVRTWAQERVRHRILWRSGNRQRSLFAALRGTADGYCASAWICPADGRLYSFTRLGSAAELERGPLPAGRLSCCGEIGLTEIRDEDAQRIHL